LLEGLIVFLSLWRLVHLSKQRFHIFGGGLLLAVCLSPLFIQQSFAVSSDVVVNAFTLMVVALIVAAEQFTLFDECYFVLLGILACSTKPPVIISCAAALIFWWTHRPNREPSPIKFRRFLCWLILFSAIGVATTQTDLKQIELHPFHKTLSELAAPPSVQIETFVQNPARALWKIGDGFYGVLFKQPFAMAGPLGWNTEHPPKILGVWVLLLLLGGLLDLLVSPLALNFRRWGKGLILVAGGLLYGCAVSLALYVRWSRPDEPTVIGMQGRLLFSVLLLGIPGLRFGLASETKPAGREKPFLTRVMLSSFLVLFFFYVYYLCAYLVGRYY
jgi:hypothetical protein